MVTTVKDYIHLFMCEVNDALQWKLLKGSRQLKKKVKDIVFQIDFHSSKYNSLQSQIEIRCTCGVWCRAFAKELNMESAVGHFEFLERDNYWWDITGDENRARIKSELIAEINTKITPIIDWLAMDFDKGLCLLVKDRNFNSFSNDLQLADMYLGREAAIQIANSYVNSFTELERNLAKGYMEGSNSLSNERNLRYLITHHLAEIR